MLATEMNKAELVEEVASLRQRVADLEAARDDTARRAISERRLVDALDVCPTGIALFDREDRLVTANRHYHQHMMGGEALSATRPDYESLLRRNVARGHYANVEKGEGEAWLKARLRQRRMVSSSFEVELGDGRWLLAMDRRTPVGEVITVVSDVTELKRNETALRDSEGRFRAILDNVGDGVVIIDESGRIESFSRAAESFLGYAEEETLGRNVRMLMGRDDAEHHDEYVERYLETGVSRILGVGPREVTARRGDGSDAEMELVISEVWLAGTRKFIGVLRDISQRKEAEKALRESEERFRDFAEGTFDWLWEVDGDWKLTWISQQFDRLSGLHSRDVLGKTMWAAFPSDPQMREEWRKVAEEVGENRVVRDFEYSVTLADGSKRRRSTNCKGIFDPAGRFVGVRGATLDITATAAAEHRAIQAETRLKDAIDALPVGFQWFDADERLIMFNEEAQRRFRDFGVPLEVGDTYEEVVRRNVTSGILPEASGREEAFVRERLEAHHDQTGPTELRTGEDEWLLTSEYRMPDGSYVRINTDISELKRNEAALRESEERFRDFAEATSDWFWEADSDFRIIWVSEQFERKSGLLSQDVLGRRPWEMPAMDRDIRDGVRELSERMRSEGVVRDVRYASTLPDGQRHYRSTSGKCIRDGEARITGYRGTTTDITERVEAEHRASRAEANLRDAIDALPVGFEWYDGDGRLTMFNAKADALSAPLVVGKTFEQILRANIAHGLLPDATGRVDEYVDKRLVARDRLRGPVEVRISEEEWLLITEHRMGDGSLVTISTEITELKRHERALLDAMQTAEQANLAKSKFLAAASHDLRQPLQALILMLRLLGSRASDAKTMELVGDAQGALDIMARLLNALLDMSKLDAGLVAPDMAPFDVGALLKRLGRQFAPQVDEKGLELRLVAPDVWGMSDVGLLERIVENLLANAVRYTDEGRILLGCRRRGGRLRIEVWDTGIGIAEDQQAEIFSEFHQIGNAERNLTRGLGLGLAIVDRLAALLGHSIDLRSVPGGGSVFTVELPLAEAAAAPSDALIVPESEMRLLEGMTALVIEDDDAVRRAMAMVLEELKLSVWQASNGTEALSLLDGTGVPPDVIFADYRLSKGTWGHEVIAEIRRRFRRQVMAAIITGDTAPAEISEIHASGCRLLYKPVDLHAIVDVLQAARRASLH